MPNRTDPHVDVLSSFDPQGSPKLNARLDRTSNACDGGGRALVAEDAVSENDRAYLEREGREEQRSGYV